MNPPFHQELVQLPDSEALLKKHRASTKRTLPQRGVELSKQPDEFCIDVHKPSFVQHSSASWLRGRNSPGAFDNSCSPTPVSPIDKSASPRVADQLHRLDAMSIGVLSFSLGSTIFLLSVLEIAIHPRLRSLWGILASVVVVADCLNRFCGSKYPVMTPDICRCRC